jgi:glutamate-5-semialdehyde dehydrogenase
MGGPEMAPHTPPTFGAARRSRAAPLDNDGDYSKEDMSLRELVEGKARAARRAADALALCSTRVKDEALTQMARALEEKSAALLEANRRDVDRARVKGLTRAFIDRLTLTEARIEQMAQGLREIAAFPDPVGTVVESWRRPNGIEISRVTVPLGVIGFIYESRPNVTADAAGLCVKSGNAVLLRGGSEAIESNTLLAAVLGKALEKTGAPPDAIQFLDVTDREAVALMLEQDRYLDLVIPRGGEEFVRWVAERSRVPVLKHDKGLVHVFVDAGADLDMATAIVLNAKTHRPSVCNALETLLVDGAVAPRFLPAVAARLSEAGVELRGCPRTLAIVPSARAATEADWDEEYLDLVLAIRVVDGLDEAIAHIRRHGTGLAEAIVTNDLARARRFTREVDAAGVLVNASTRLLDGQQFGMGAEMGISTSRVHARGPVGVRALTTTKFVVQGDGQVRD